jgi:hypothetical protein
MGVATVFILFFTLLPALAGVIMVIVGVRGREVSRLPACAKCRFDLSGIWPITGQSVVCPECGSPLARPKAVRHVQRARRWGLLAMGVFILIGPLVFGTVALSGWALTPAGAQYWPGWALRAVMGLGQMPDIAAPELTRRAQAGELTGRAARAAADSALRLQASSGFAWRPEVGDLFQELASQGLVTPEQARRYVEKAGTPRIEWRARIGAMQPLPVNIGIGPLRVGSTKGVLMGIESVVAVSDDGREWRSRGRSTSRVSATGAMTWLAHIPVELEEGIHRLTLRTQVRAWAGDNYSEEPIGYIDVESVAVVQVLPRGVLSVDMRRDEGLAPAIRSAIKVRDMQLEVFLGDLWLNGMVVLENAPMGCSFEIFARQRQEEGSVREWRIGEMSARAHAGAFWNGVHAKVPGMRPGVLDIVLRSSPGPAQKRVEVLEAWDGEVVFEGVEVVERFPPP